ncbi:MAG: type II secretion system protein [Planctomycetota bacterium]|jgi:hypothetical protein
MHHPHRSCPRPRATARATGFTILELLVSLALIALLISLVVVSFRGVRASANRTESLNALRNMMRGYVTYHTDHRGNLMPGFVDEDVLNALDLDAELEDGSSVDQCGAGGRCDASSYVWRLASYLDDAWKTVYVDYKSKALFSVLENRYRDGQYGPASDEAGDGLQIASIPAFGLNSIFLGGDNVHGDNATLARNPFDPADPNDVIAATRMNQVKNPPRITVFGTTMLPPDSPFQPTNAPGGLAIGYPELRAPFTGIDEDGNGVNQQWAINNAGIIEAVGGNFGNGGGWPVGRWGEDDIPVGHLDGSVEVVERFELATEMSRWSPFVTGIR